jgi:hypothetical protein
VNATAENAIHEWVRLASGLPAEAVLWEGRHPYPPGTWIQMRVTSSRDFGAPWVDRAKSGNDVVYTARGLRTELLELQCIDGAEGGESSCVSLLDLVIRKQLLPTYRAALSLAGVGVGAAGPVQWIPGKLEDRFEPRAVVTIQLNLASEVSETGPAIEHVEVEGQVADANVDVWSPDAPPP